MTRPALEQRAIAQLTSAETKMAVLSPKWVDPSPLTTVTSELVFGMKYEHSLNKCLCTGKGESDACAQESEKVIISTVRLAIIANSAHFKGGHML